MLAFPIVIVIAAILIFAFVVNPWVAGIATLVTAILIVRDYKRTPLPPDPQGTLHLLGWGCAFIVLAACTVIIVILGY